MIIVILVDIMLQYIFFLLIFVFFSVCNMFLLNSDIHRNQFVLKVSSVWLLVKNYTRLADDS